MASKSYGIHDKWTDINKINNVDIKSVDGVIESVKINGEEAGGGGGSSDLSTANMQIVNPGGHPINLRGAIVFRNRATSGGYPEYNESAVVPIILYKGIAVLIIEIISTGNISISGAITSNDDGNYVITGDCTITIS